MSWTLNENNEWVPYSEEEVLSWDKYPKEFAYLPMNFDSNETDTKAIKNIEGVLFEENLVLVPNKEFLGVKRKQTISKKEIPWGEIYIINAIGTSLYKIGHSTKFSRRFRDLNAASPLPLRVVKYARCDNPNLLENHLHDLYADRFFKNEWFSLSKKNLLEIDEIFNRFFDV